MLSAQKQDTTVKFAAQPVHFTPGTLPTTVVAANHTAGRTRQLLSTGSKLLCLQHAHDTGQLNGVTSMHLLVAEPAQHACLHGSRLHGAGAAVCVATVAAVL
jgi:hypothetical protein